MEITAVICLTVITLAIIAAPIFISMKFDVEYGLIVGFLSLIPLVVILIVIGSIVSPGLEL